MSSNPVAAVVSIRDMTVSDLPDVIAIEGASLPTQWSEHSYRILLGNSDTVCKVAEVGGKMVGFVSSHIVIDDAQIYNLAVYPQFRRQGIARVLLGALFEDIDSRFKGRVFLEVRVNNDIAIGLYKSFGFNEQTIRKGYYTNPVADALIMMRKTG